MRIVLLVLFLGGCANVGIDITEEDRAECAETKDCSVWSGRQLEGLALRFFRSGFQRGQQARNL